MLRNMQKRMKNLSTCKVIHSSFTYSVNYTVRFVAALQNEVTTSTSHVKSVIILMH